MKDFHVHVPIPCKEPHTVHVPFQSLETGPVPRGQASLWYSFNGDAEELKSGSWSTGFLPSCYFPDAGN